jgi:glutaredoxin 3
VQCDIHNLICGPDGLCVLCRRPAAAAQPPTRTPLIFGVAVALCMAGASVYRWESLRPLAQPTASPAQAKAADPTAANLHVVVYTTSWCPHCRDAKQWLHVRGVPYEERDIEASPENERMMRQVNSRGGVPTFDVNGEVLVGFSAQALESLLQRAKAQPATHPLLPI